VSPTRDPRTMVASSTTRAGEATPAFAEDLSADPPVPRLSRRSKGTPTAAAIVLQQCHGPARRLLHTRHVLATNPSQPGLPPTQTTRQNCACAPALATGFTRTTTDSARQTSASGACRGLEGLEVHRPFATATRTVAYARPPSRLPDGRLQNRGRPARLARGERSSPGPDTRDQERGAVPAAVIKVWGE